jgi:hypothetical protein
LIATRTSAASIAGRSTRISSASSVSYVDRRRALAGHRGAAAQLAEYAADLVGKLAKLRRQHEVGDSGAHTA